jgi:hypothetical protein
LTDVSEVRTAAIIGVIINLMMDAVHTSEKSVYFDQTKRRYIPESFHFQARATPLMDVILQKTILRIK